VTTTTATLELLESEAATEGPLRRCLVTGEVRPKSQLIRFVVDPAGRLVPDISERLPGRGLWTGATRDIIATAVKKRLFPRAARATVIRYDILRSRPRAEREPRCARAIVVEDRVDGSLQLVVRVGR